MLIVAVSLIVAFFWDRITLLRYFHKPIAYSDTLAMGVIESIEGYTVFSLAFATIVLQLHPSINTSENKAGLNGYILASWIIWGVFWLEPIEQIVRCLHSYGCGREDKEEDNKVLQSVMEEKVMEGE